MFWNPSPEVTPANELSIKLCDCCWHWFMIKSLITGSKWILEICCLSSSSEKQCDYCYLSFAKTVSIS